MVPPLPSPPPRDAQLLPNARLFRCVLLIGSAAICFTFAIIGGHDGWKAIEYERNRHETVRNNGHLWRGALLGTAIVLVVSGYLEWQIRRERSLARTGLATHGTVKEIRVRHGSRGPRGWRIDFEFTASDGSMRNGRDLMPVTLLTDLPIKGDKVVVLFDNGGPQRNRLLLTLRYVDKASLFRVKTAD